MPDNEPSERDRKRQQRRDERLRYEAHRIIGLVPPRWYDHWAVVTFIGIVFLILWGVWVSKILPLFWNGVKSPILLIALVFAPAAILVLYRRSTIREFFKGISWKDWCVATLLLLVIEVGGGAGWSWAWMAMVWLGLP